MVAPQVYAFLGDNTETSPSNGGFVANAGFVVGSEGVIVIDTGATYAHGERMLAAIAKLTPLPVVRVIITHAVQDFVFGAAAFAARGIPILAHRKTAELMRARCEHCLGNMAKILDPRDLADTRLVLPDQTIDGSQVVQIGGRELALTWLGWASTPGDLVVVDTRTQVVFGGGMVTVNRVPEIRDGDHQAWLKALDALLSMRAGPLVPGYGPIGQLHDAGATRQYLLDLDRKMRALYAAGKGLMEAVDSADLAIYQGWSMYPEQHRRNALRRYLQLEVEDLEKVGQ